MSDSTPIEEMLFVPLIPPDRRRSDRMHFGVSRGQYLPAATFCGLSTKHMDSGCLDDMEAWEALAQIDTCKRCIHSVRALSGDQKP